MDNVYESEGKILGEKIGIAKTTEKEKNSLLLSFILFRLFCLRNFKYTLLTISLEHDWCNETDILVEEKEIKISQHNR